MLQIFACYALTSRIILNLLFVMIKWLNLMFALGYLVKVSDVHRWQIHANIHVWYEKWGNAAADKSKADNLQLYHC